MARKILSINHNKSMNYMLQTVFSTKFKLICVSDALGALSELKKQKEIDLILIDLDYNLAENLDFIHHISGSWLYRKPLIIIKSNPIEEGLLSTDVSYNFFPKPFSPVQLLKAVDNLILSQTLVA